MQSLRLPIDRLRVRPYTLPTNGLEADGTIEWNSTTLVLVEAYAGGLSGLGYSYADAAAASVAERNLFSLVRAKDAMNVPECWRMMIRAVRNIGRPGIASHAIAAIDMALWDLKAKLLGLPLATLLGKTRDAIPVYGSGGFTSYSIARLEEQLARWVAQGIQMVKMKVGSAPSADSLRVRAARAAIGPAAQLFVDANGAYSRKQALAFAEDFAASGVSWFEEPVSSDDLEGLRLLRDRCPPGMAIAAGEYGYDLGYFRRMLAAEAVDVLQADATRCLGVTGFMKAAALCEAWGLPLSAHTSPTAHAHLCCAAQSACHVEYFYDHARIESLLFEGALLPEHGQLRPKSETPGLGLRLLKNEAARFAA